MTTAVITLSIVLGMVFLGALLGIGKRSSLESKIFELKAENYSLEKRSAKLQADMLNLKASWHHMKSTSPLNISDENSQALKSGETSS